MTIRDDDTLVKQPAQQEPIEEFAYKAITKRGEHFHFRTHAAARIWAGEGGKVEAIKLRHLELVEQPAQQQEPVAYMNPDDLEKMKRFGRGSVAWATPTDFCTQPVYTSPPASKPLTDEQLADILPDDDTPMSLGEAFVKFARAIEAAHGIKGDA